MKIVLLLCVAVAMLASIVSAQTTASPQKTAPYVRPTAEKRFKYFVVDTVGPLALAGDAVSAGYLQWAKDPREWGKGWNGYGKRFATTFGVSVVQNTMIYGVDEILKVDSHFYVIGKGSAAKRAENALISGFTARRSNGERTIGVSRLLGTYTANIVAREFWYPRRFNWKHGIRDGTYSLGINAAFNLFREFVLKR